MLGCLVEKNEDSVEEQRKLFCVWFHPPLFFKAQIRMFMIQEEGSSDEEAIKDKSR